ncbi:MAG: hypothetical protein ABIJ12_01085 [bacterium]
MYFNSKDERETLAFFDNYYIEIEMFKKYNNNYGDTFYIMKAES